MGCSPTFTGVGTSAVWNIVGARRNGPRPDADGAGGGGGGQGCRFAEIIGGALRLHRALTCNTIDFMFRFWKFCLELRFSTF